MSSELILCVYEIWCGTMEFAKVLTDFVLLRHLLLEGNNLRFNICLYLCAGSCMLRLHRTVGPYVSVELRSQHLMSFLRGVDMAASLLLVLVATQFLIDVHHEAAQSSIACFLMKSMTYVFDEYAPRN